MADLNVNSIGDASGGNTTTINGQTPTLSNMAGRNRIINGDMRIFQRAQSATGVTGTGYYTADRARTSMTGTGTATVNYEVLTNQSVMGETMNALKSVVTTTDPDRKVRYNQRIEISNCIDLSGKTITLSFYAKADSPITLNNIYLSDASTGNLTSVVFDSVELTTSWQRFSMSATLDDLTASSYLDVVIGLYGETVNLTNATWYLTGVQLEAGSVATPFEHRQYGTELALCQRYYYRWVAPASTVPIGMGYAYATTSTLTLVPFPVPMRVRPTALETTGTASDYRIVRAGPTVITCSSTPAYSNSSTANGQVLASASGLTAGEGLLLHSNATGAFLGWSAEL